MSTQTQIKPKKSPKIDPMQKTYDRFHTKDGHPVIVNEKHKRVSVLIEVAGAKPYYNRYAFRDDEEFKKACTILPKTTIKEFDTWWYGGEEQSPIIKSERTNEQRRALLQDLSESHIEISQWEKGFLGHVLNQEKPWTEKQISKIDSILDEKMPF